MLTKNCLLISGILFSTGTFAELDFRTETKLNYRHSEANAFPTAFPFPAIALPVGQSTGLVETVDAGSHAEISNIALFLDWDVSENWAVKSKVDLIDLYERNPTSGDRKADLDQLIIRYGKKHTQGPLPRTTTGYAQIGKFGKLERQEDRHLESYGLSGTAFNRVEDSGIEMGVDFTKGLYAKLSYTTGNPVFMRDTNALAGDNGIDRTPPPNDDPEIKTGIPILYDAEVETFNLSDTPETGIALGYRWLNDDGTNRVNLMLFGYERELAETQELHGTFYGGDLDLLDLSEQIQNVRLPITKDKKKEFGFNLWWYTSRASVFMQAIRQDLAGLERDGSELELSYALLDSKTIFGISQISPVIRYSIMDNHFVGDSRFPSPSFWWDWEKLDVGINTDFGENIRLTLEYAINEFKRKEKIEENNEFLLTLRWRFN
jgi:hypothetical protein